MMTGKITKCRPTGNQYENDGCFRITNGMRISIAVLDLICDMSMVDIDKDVDWDYEA